MRNYQVQVLNANDDVTRTGAAVFVGQAVAASFCPTCSDTGAGGTLKVQGSNVAPVGNPASFSPPDASFCDIPNATSSISAGVGSAIVLQTMNFQYVRVVYTSSAAGSGTIEVNMSALGV